LKQFFFLSSINLSIISLIELQNGVISAWRGSSEADSPFKLVASLQGHTKSVVCLAIGTLTKLYSGSEDQSIKVFLLFGNMESDL
jgi:hypothetical protein